MINILLLTQIRNDSVVGQWSFINPNPMKRTTTEINQINFLRLHSMYVYVPKATLQTRIVSND